MIFNSQLALKVRSSFERFWCTVAHDSPMWPIRGRYQCRRCFLYHPVRWEITATDREHRSAKPTCYPPTMLKALGAADLERVLARATKIDDEPLFDQPTTPEDLDCGHDDHVRLRIDPQRAA